MLRPTGALRAAIADDVQVIDALQAGPFCKRGCTCVTLSLSSSVAYLIPYYFQKPSNRFAASSLYRTVWLMLRWPR